MQTVFGTLLSCHDEVRRHCFRAARESLYWLRICSAIPVGPADQLRRLQGEADQLVRILTAIAVNTKRRL